MAFVTLFILVSLFNNYCCPHSPNWIAIAFHRNREREREKKKLFTFFITLHIIINFTPDRWRTETVTNSPKMVVLPDRHPTLHIINYHLAWNFKVCIYSP
jgi:hypothetical protein